MTPSASKDFATATAIITFRVNVTSVAIKLIELLTMPLIKSKRSVTRRPPFNFQ